MDLQQSDLVDHESITLGESGMNWFEDEPIQDSGVRFNVACANIFHVGGKSFIQPQSGNKALHVSGEETTSWSSSPFLVTSLGETQHKLVTSSNTG